MTKDVKRTYLLLAVPALVILTLICLLATSVAAAPVAAKGPGKVKDIEYSFTFVNGVTVAGHSTSNDVDPVPGGFSGMVLHVSCSDIFTDGWASKGSPVRADGAGWRVASYRITHYKDGAVDKFCAEEFYTPTTTTTAAPPTTTTAPPATTVPPSTTVPPVVTTAPPVDVPEAPEATPVDAYPAFTG
jgi:hypothetical protein